MRRMNWKTVSTLVTMVVVAGCSESAVAPHAVLQDGAAASVALAPQDRPTLSLSGDAGGNESTSFTVGPQGGVFFVGNQAVVFPAHSICDPATSGYGTDTWNDSCTPLSQPITIHAVTREANGRSQVDFSPSLRFVPSANPAKWVWMYMYTPSAARSSNLSQFTIFYAPTLDAQLVDESLIDSTLRTYVDQQSGVSLRRIKHFSGYVVVSGAVNPPPCSDESSCNQSSTP